MVAEQYKRVIQLAQRAMELESELQQVQLELAEAQAQATGGDITGFVPVSGSGPSFKRAQNDHDSDLAPSLAKQMLAIFRQHPGKVMTGEDIARALEHKDVNMIRSYLNRAAKKKQLKAVRRGHYQWAGGANSPK
jgi:hypothetical protein